MSAGSAPSRENFGEEKVGGAGCGGRGRGASCFLQKNARGMLRVLRACPRGKRSREPGADFCLGKTQGKKKIETIIKSTRILPGISPAPVTNEREKSAGIDWVRLSVISPVIISDYFEPRAEAAAGNGAERAAARPGPGFRPPRPLAASARPPLGQPGREEAGEQHGRFGVWGSPPSPEQVIPAAFVHPAFNMPEKKNIIITFTQEKNCLQGEARLPRLGEKGEAVAPRGAAGFWGAGRNWGTG